MPLFSIGGKTLTRHAAAGAVHMLHILLPLHILLLLHGLLLPLHILLLHRCILHSRRGILLCITYGRENVTALSVGGEECNKFDGEYVTDNVVFIADIMQNHIIAADGIQYAKAACHALRAKQKFNLHIGAKIILQNILEGPLHGNCVKILRRWCVDAGLCRGVVIVHEDLRCSLSIGVCLCGIVETVIADAYDKLSDA